MQKSVNFHKLPLTTPRSDLPRKAEETLLPEKKKKKTLLPSENNDRTSDQ